MFDNLAHGRLNRIEFLRVDRAVDSDIDLVDNVANLAKSVLQGYLQLVLRGYLVQLQNVVLAVILDFSLHGVSLLVENGLLESQERLDCAIYLELKPIKRQRARVNFWELPSLHLVRVSDQKLSGGVCLELWWYAVLIYAWKMNRLFQRADHSVDKLEVMLLCLVHLSKLPV